MFTVLASCLFCTPLNISNYLSKKTSKFRKRLYAIWKWNEYFKVLVQFKPTNAHKFIKITKISRNTNSYVFQTCNRNSAILSRIGNENVKHIFYTIVCPLMMVQKGPKHVGFGVLWYYCNCNFNKTVCNCWFEL